VASPIPAICSDNPNDFLEWLQAHNYNFTAESFVPRAIFGDFLSEKLAEAKQILADNLLIINDKAINIEINDTDISYKIDFENSQSINVEMVVLAVGADIPASVSAASNQIFNNPYEAKILDKIAQNKKILIIGNGLTMVDWAISLKQTVNPQAIYSISRRGQLPKSHFLQAEKWEVTAEEAKEILTIRQFFNHFKNSIKIASVDNNVAWQAVLDAYRCHLAIIWDNFSKKDKQIFLRFFRPYWDSLRFRCPKESTQMIEIMQNENIFIPLTGKILDIQAVDNQLKIIFQPNQNQQKTEIQVDYLINCTGAANFKQKMTILYQNLVNNQLAKIDALNIGLETDENGQLICPNQLKVNLQDTKKINPIYCLGAVRKAKEWETTSIQSIRKQSQQLAENVYNQLVSVKNCL
jgi:uncharacterized NAD(P)/FAD-binding protein YdhS